MTPNRDVFTTYKPTNQEGGISDAQGGVAKPLGIGTVIIQTGEAILKLDDVRHIPTLKTNLISTVLLEKQGFVVDRSKTTPSH